ncbi:unnamed protein product [Paramecium octaurelia]|uniref:Uncharacterized protein n=1 Tax=Paramecium octaurelia TaxID=43137 RepID=A0A8S1TPU7_PAROT|nr:unnamed protein product [Paramecium octaurelia]
MDQDLYIYPGITKNLTKTMCGKLKRFIKKQFKDQSFLQDDPKVKEFLDTSQYDYKVLNLTSLKQSTIGKEIVNFFFGNLIWCQDINELNKLDINYYFQFNHVWYDQTEEDSKEKKDKQDFLEKQEKQEKQEKLEWLEKLENASDQDAKIKKVKID